MPTPTTPPTATPVPAPVTCYAIADGVAGESSDSDDVDDTFLRFDIVGGTASVQIIGEASGMATDNVEALAIRPGAPNPIWVWDTSGGLFTVDPTTAEVTEVDDFKIDLDADVAGLTWANVADADLDNDVLYAIDVAGDILAYHPDGTPAGSLANPATTDLHDAADIGWDPTSGKFYALLTDHTDDAGVRIIDSGLGAWHTELDTEGLGFSADGRLWLTTGDDGDDTLYAVYKPTIAETPILDIAAATGVADVEAIDCMPLSHF